MRSNRGFSLAELLTVIAIMGILATGFIVAYSRYMQSSRLKAIHALGQSSIRAMEEYVMDHPSADGIEINTLYSEGYLEKPKDPYYPSFDCSGKVVKDGVEGDNKTISKTSYKVTICCHNNNFTYSDKNDKLIRNDTCQTS